MPDSVVRSLSEAAMARSSYPAPGFVPAGKERAMPGRYSVVMQITVKLFAALRERAGERERGVELPDGARVGDVWPVLELGDEPPGIAYARNREYAERELPLHDGDEVAVIPPVSGGSFRVLSAPLDLTALVAEVSDPGCGAIATFIGTTRDANRGRTVTHLEYDAYPEMAEQEMRRIADALHDRHDITKVAIAHRTG